MSILPATSGAQGVGLSDGDLDQIVDSFRDSARGLLELRLDGTRLRLRRPSAPPPAATGPVAIVSAPFVGVFASSLSTGQTVGEGMALGNIRSVQGETMVSAPHDGTITAQLAANGDFVAFGDPLIEILPQTPDQGQTQ